MTRCNSVTTLVALAVLLLVSLVRSDDKDVRKQLAELDEDSKNELIRRRQRFDRMPNDQKNRLRQLHAKINDHPQSDKLRRVMRRYYGWLRGLPSAKRAELRDLPRGKRIERIRQIMRTQELERFRRLADEKLPKSDLRLIVWWAEKYIEQHEKKLIERTIPDERTRERLKRLTPQRRQRALMFYFVRPNNRSGSRLRFSPQDMSQVRSKLSAEANRRLDEYKDMPQRQRAMMQRWIRAAVISRFVPYPDRADLQNFYNVELKDSDRERLENMPADRLRRELRRMYYSYRMQRFDGGKKRRPPWARERKRRGGRGRFFPPENRERKRPADRRSGDR